jgi:hypothetical protein
MQLIYFVEVWGLSVANSPFTIKEYILSKGEYLLSEENCFMF